MWATTLTFLILAGAVLGGYNPWQSNKEYTYQIYSTTKTGIPELRQQYASLQSQGRLVVQTENSNNPDVLIGQVLDLQHGDHNGDIPDVEKNEQSNLNGKSFRMQLAGGIVQSLQVDESMSNDEVNQLKGILSQLQVDIRGQNLMPSPYNQLPNVQENDIPSGLYEVMEPSITGQCLVVYEISPVADYAVPSLHDHWAESQPVPEGMPVFQIVKTMNYSECDLIRSYHHGVSGWSDNLNVESNQIGDFLSRSTVSRIIASGTPAEFTIMYSESTMRVAAAPELYQKQTTLTTSSVELVLTQVSNYEAQLPKPSNPRNVGNLVYRYDIPSDKVNQARVGSHHNRRLNSEDNNQQQWNQGSNDEDDNNSSNQSNDDEPQQSSPKNRNWRTKRSSSNPNAQHDNYWQPAPTMNQPPENPFLPYYVGHQGHAIYHDLEVAAKLKTVANAISEAMEDINRIPNNHVLEYYNILADLVATASLKDIENAANSLQRHRSGSDAQEGPWQVLRDAVAVAGTGPAAQALSQWISSGKLDGDEAVAVLVIQPKVIQTPTKEMLSAYMNMIQSKTVSRQPDVHAAALISLAEIVGRSYSDRRYARNYYPEDSYGSFRQNLSNIVHGQVIEYLGQWMDKAFQSGNDRDILVSIRAYGNLGHPSYLVLFKKYYESQDDIPVYQRTALVAALDYLAVSHPELAHHVLYKIYQNTAEHPDVRSMAVLLLIMTNPPAATLQKIAAFTHQDPSSQVQSIVKYAIETIADMTGSNERAHRAQLARKFLNPQAYGSGTSRSTIYEETLKRLNYNRYKHVTVVTSPNGPLPERVSIHIINKVASMYKSFFQADQSVSNIGELLKRFYKLQAPDLDRGNTAEKIVTSPHNQNLNYDMLPNIPLPPGCEPLLAQLQSILDVQQVSTPAPGRRTTGNKRNPWIAPQPVEQNQNERLQAQIHYTYFGGQRYQAFDQKMVDSLPNVLNDMLEQYKNGRSIHFTKLYKADTVTIAFPLVTGYPYVYSWDKPSLVLAHGEVKVQTNKPITDGETPAIYVPDTINVTTRIDVLYSSDHITQAGFLTPYNGRHYVAGHVRKEMYRLPIYLDVDADLVSKNVRGALELTSPSTLLHLSSTPYTNIKDAFSLTPDTVEGSGAIPISARQSKVVNRYLGVNTTGLVLNIHGYYQTPRNIYGPIPFLVGGVPKSNLLDVFTDPSEGLELYQIEVSYDNTKTKADGVMFGFGIKSGVIRKPEQGRVGVSPYSVLKETAEPAHPGVAFLQPIDQLFELITPNITNGYATVASAWVALIGNGHQSVYEGVGSYATSRPGGFASFTAGFRRNELNYYNEKQYCTGVDIIERGNSEYASSSVDQAVEEERELGIQFRLTVGPNCVLGDKNEYNSEVIALAVLNQTADYEQYVLQSSEALQCKRDSKHGNNQSPACRSVIKDLRVPNYMNFRLHQVGSQQYVQDILEVLAWPQNNPIIRDAILSAKRIEPLSGSLLLSPDTNSFDGVVNFRGNDYEVHDLRTSPLLRKVAFGEKVYDDLPLNALIPRGSECVIDRKSMTTFDQTVINESIGRCLYIAAQTVDQMPDSGYPSKPRSQIRNITVMVADESGEAYNRQIGIQFYTGESGRPSLLQVRGRGAGMRPLATLTRDEETSVVDPMTHVEVVADGVVRLHVYPQTAADDTVVVIDLHDGSMRVVFNGDWLVIQADSSYQNRVRGLCGQNDLEPYTDKQSPNNCIFRNNKYFINSWAIPDDNDVDCQTEVRDSLARSREDQCDPIQYVRNEVVNRYEASEGGNQDYDLASSQSSGRSHARCVLRNQIQQVQSHGQTCFSSEPLATCPQHCNAGSRQRRKVSVKCYNNNDPMVRLHRQSIAKGHTKLMWGKHAVGKTLEFAVPTNCRSDWGQA